MEQRPNFLGEVTRHGLVEAISLPLPSQESPGGTTMTLVRRSMGVLLLILASLGIVCCLVGVVGVWIVFANTSSRVNAISGKVEAGLDRVSTGNDKVRRALDRAREDVAEVRQGSTEVEAGSERNSLASQALRRYVRDRAGPNLNELSGRLITLSVSPV